MRDIPIIISIVLIALIGLRRPWIGLLGWTWISLMNVHKLGWRVGSLPLAALMAGCTLLGLIMTRDKRSPFQGAAPAVLLMFMLWMCVTYPMAFYPSDSYDMWNKVMKIDMMILVAIMLIRDRAQIVALTWVLVFSLGFYGVKGGIFTILTGGSFRVWGPEGTFIEGNNEIALAFIITIPLIRFLQTQLPATTGKIFRHAFTASMVLCAVAAIGTHSRGALLAIVAMALALWWRSPNKIVGGIVLVVVGFGVAALMPSEWSSRMNTIETYDQDASAMGRINAWWMAWNLAKANLFGGGFQVYTAQIFQLYAPDPTDVHAAHSIYFQVLGEHGFIGLFLFLLVWYCVWRDCNWLRKHGAAHPESRWVVSLSAMCQVSLIGYLVGGAFLSLAYFDLPYNLLVLSVAAKRWVMAKGWEHEPKPDEKSRMAKIGRTLGVTT